MRAVLIDPDKREVLEVEVDEQSIFTLLGCQTIELIQPAWSPALLDKDAVYVDEDGLLSQKARWTWCGKTVWSGKGIVVGHTDDGEMTSARAALMTVAAAVEFF